MFSFYCEALDGYIEHDLATGDARVIGNGREWIVKPVRKADRVLVSESAR